MDSEEIENKKLTIKIFKWVICIVLVLIIIFAVITPLAKPWWATQTGKAELAQAEQNRQIIVIQAIADKDAEITRAEGVAKANEIIGQSLKGNEDYLRYLYITGVTSNSNNREVIYIPTEAGLPILEAGRLNEVK
jgi:regulator of protease activity HflC (stomatin/prohibitin superfamily)